MNPAKEKENGKSRFFLSKNSFRRNRGSLEDIRKSSKNDMDTFSESGFKISNLNFHKRISSFYDRQSRSNSISLRNQPLLTSVLIEELKPLDGVMLFINDSKGICGQLSISQKRASIQFKSLGRRLQTTNNDEQQVNKLPEKTYLLKKTLARNPIEEIDFDHCEIDFFNILDLHEDIHKETHDLILHIFCQNFRYVKFMIRQSENAKNFVECIYKISTESKKLVNPDFEDSSFCLFNSLKNCLWQYLYQSYPYQSVTDWKKHELWYIENYRTRFVLNDNFIMGTLPKAFIIPARMSDPEINKILLLSNGYRIPVISYLHRKSNHFLIRSTTFNEYTTYTILSKYVLPLKELHINQSLPPLSKIIKYYQQVRNQSYSVTKRNNNITLAVSYEIGHSKKFWSKCNDWLWLISKTLTYVNDLVDLIQNETSIVLSERNDIHWNCLLSSLIQIIIDPSRRTINGFECLISKEWIYLAGYRSVCDHNNKYKIANTPNVPMFHLFLDCVHQLIIQNTTMFEFTTFYLLALIDVQFQADSYDRVKTKQFEANKEHELIQNPFFDSNISEDVSLKVKATIHEIQLFYALFFRSIKSDVGKYTLEEYLHMMELKNSGHL